MLQRQKIWGERRGSNPRQLDSQTRALPAELRPPSQTLQEPGSGGSIKSQTKKQAFIICLLFVCFLKAKNYRTASISTSPPIGSAFVFFTA